MNERIALVTGAARGIGREVARQLALLGHTVLLTDREREGFHTANELSAQGLRTAFLELDVTDLEHIEYAFRYVRNRYGKLDILVNDAGINTDRGTISTVRREALERTFAINTRGPLELMQRFVPLMRERNYGRVVNLASETAALSSMVQSNWPAYRIAKAGLVAVTRMYAAELADANVLVNCMCPGWTNTEMGRADGVDPPRTVEQAADTAVWLATLPDDGPRGGFFRDRKPLPW